MTQSWVWGQVCSPRTWEAEARGQKVQANLSYIMRVYLKKEKGGNKMSQLVKAFVTQA